MTYEMYITLIALTSIAGISFFVFLEWPDFVLSAF